MKFSCERCSTSYVIADDKIGRGLKVRCKKCGNIILIRGQRVATPDSDDPVPSDDVTQRAVAPTAAAGEDDSPLDSSPGEGATEPGSGSLLSGLSFDDEKTAVYDPSSEMLEQAGADGAAMDGGAPDGGGDEDLAPPADESTRVFDVEQMKELVEERERAAAEKRERPAVGMPGFAVQPPRPAADPVWYMAIEGRQVGPLPIDEVRRRIEKGEVDPTTYCWRSGFKDWISLSGVPELERVFNEVRPSAVVSTDAGAASAESGVVSVSARRPLATGRMYGARATADEELFAASAAAEPEAEPDEVAIGGKREEHKPSQRQRKLTAVEFDLSELASMAQEEIEEAESPEEEEDERAAAAEVARDLATSDPFAEDAVRVESRAEDAAADEAPAGLAAEAEDGAEDEEEPAAAGDDEPASVKDLINEELAAAEEEPREVERVVIGRAKVRQPGELQERVPDEAQSEEAFQRREAPVSMARRESVDRGSLVKVVVISALGAILFFALLLPFGLVIGGKVKIPGYYGLVYGDEEDERTARTEEPAKTEGKDEGKAPARDEGKDEAAAKADEAAEAKAKAEEATAEAEAKAKVEEAAASAEPDDSELDDAAKKVAAKKKAGKKLSRAERRALAEARAEARQRRKEAAKARAEERKRKREEARAERERKKREREEARAKDTRRAPTPAASDDAGDFDDILDDAPAIPRKKTAGSGSHRRHGGRRTKRSSAAVDPDFGDDDDFAPAPKRRAKKEEPLPPPPKETKKGAPLPDTLDKKTVLAVIKRGLPKIKKCAQEQVSRDKSQVVKKIILAFTIQRNGRCTGVSVGPSKVKGSYLESCVKRTVGTWKYPKFFGENIKIKLPLPVAVR